MSGLSPRLQRRIQASFPRQVEPVTATLARLQHDLFANDPADPAGDERILAAVVLLANGDLQGIDSAVALARTDWRDLLVAAKLEHADWPSRLDAELGPAE
jgi:hypothetical protein